MLKFHIKYKVYFKGKILKIWKIEIGERDYFTLSKTQKIYKRLFKLV